MAEIINSNDFDLMSNFGAIWLDKNEFCKESIFESNQLPEGKHGQVVGKVTALIYQHLFRPTSEHWKQNR